MEPRQLRSPDLSGLRFRVADTPGLRAQALEVRRRGYHRYFRTVEEAKDEQDERSTLLVCQANGGDILGCLRLTTCRPFELDAYCDVTSIVPAGARPLEVSRFCVPRTDRSPDVKLGLWKTAFLLSRRSGFTHFLVSARRSARRDYDFLGFEARPGPPFDHFLLGNTPHYILSLDLVAAPDRYQAISHPLHSFFCVESHPDIMLPEVMPGER